jgi:hypothetical protein
MNNSIRAFNIGSEHMDPFSLPFHIITWNINKSSHINIVSVLHNDESVSVMTNWLFSYRWNFLNSWFYLIYGRFITLSDWLCSMLRMIKIHKHGGKRLLWNVDTFLPYNANITSQKTVLFISTTVKTSNLVRLTHAQILWKICGRTNIDKLCSRWYQTFRL